MLYREHESYIGKGGCIEECYIERGVLFRGGIILKESDM